MISKSSIPITLLLVSILLTSCFKEDCGPVFLSEKLLSEQSLDYFPFDEFKQLVFVNNVGSEQLVPVSNALSFPFTDRIQLPCDDGMDQFVIFDTERKSLLYELGDQSISVTGLISYVGDSSIFTNQFIERIRVLHLDGARELGAIGFVPNALEAPATVYQQFEDFVPLGDVELLDKTFTGVFGQGIPTSSNLMYNRTVGVISYTDQDGVQWVYDREL